MSIRAIKTYEALHVSMGALAVAMGIDSIPVKMLEAAIEEQDRVNRFSIELLEQLKANQSLLRSLLDAMPDGYFETRSADSKLVGSTFTKNELLIKKAEGA